MNIVDLFSGAGGLTFGFYYQWVNGAFSRRTNNNFIFANEFDHYAAEAFRMNFEDINMIERDIKDLKEEEIREILNGEDIDIIIGGPPCQSFSSVGKRVYDDKAKMYEEYLRLLSIIRPKMFLFENVKGILSMRETFYETDENGEVLYEDVNKANKKPIVKEYGDLIMDKINKEFSSINETLGYRIEYKTLNAVDFGVPQNRERVFIVGVRNDLDIQWEFPTPTHGKELLSHLTLRDAISDFPKANVGEHLRVRRSKQPTNDYQRMMRSDRPLTHHAVSEHGEKLQLIMRHVRCGEGKNYINNLVDAGTLPELCRLTSGYNNTYGRLMPNVPCTTITNNMTTPSALRCIHYREARTISPREGARIQSFPDWFEFTGMKKHITSQIGNAVPPLLAMALADKIEEILEGVNNE